MQKGFWGPVSLGDAHGSLPSRRALLVADDSSVIRGWTRHPPVWIAGSGSLLSSAEAGRHFRAWRRASKDPRRGVLVCSPEVSSLSRLCSHSHYPSGEMEQLGESETSRVSLVPAGFGPSSWLSFLSVRCPAPDQPPVVWGHGV